MYVIYERTTSSANRYVFLDKKKGNLLINTLVPFYISVCLYLIFNRIQINTVYLEVPISSG